ncbi:peptidase S28 [Polychytrium aggregatum]|uniref:peptidase S28 n=1 Tax=Polychytrium aggregatum TaxID=110093 RepID=UPI0022FE347C|nr:peptidase S28 [Polychytrium aggregatum]KAI9209079.1 peptidase S28 [Polychytrium aggregatum]
MVALNISKLIALVLAPTAVLGSFAIQQIQKNQHQTQVKAILGTGGESVLGGPTPYWIDQPLDHFSPKSNGTFRQKYFFNDQYYKPGGPVWLFVGGEVPLDGGWVTSTGMVLFTLANKTNGIMAAIEHRYYGDSMPFPDYSTKNMAYLSSHQAIEDIVAFVKNFTATHNLPSCTKWIPVSGSYPGDLAAWLRELYPDIFWAAYSSSAPLRAKADFFEYSLAVRQGIPKIGGSEVCLNNLIRTVSLFDAALKRDPKGTRRYLGLGSIELDGDVGSMLPTSALAGSVQFGPSAQFYNSSVTHISAACSGKYFPSFANPNATDSQLWTDLQRWMYGYLDGMGIIPNNATELAALETKNMADPSNSYRPWCWQTCTEFGFFQDAEHVQAPVYSKTVNMAYYKRACAILFGKDHQNPHVAQTNKRYRGTNIKTSRISFVNSEIDPWHMLSIYNRTSTDAQPVFLHDEFHCLDMYAPRPDDTPLLSKVKVEVMAAWDKFMAGDTCRSQLAN